MRAEKRFDRPRVRLAGIGRHDGSLEREKLFAGADNETVMRHCDDIGFYGAGELKANRHSTRAGAGRIIRNGRVGRTFRETYRYGHRSSLEVSGFGQGSGPLRGRKRALAYDPFRMDRAKARFVSRHLKHGVKDLMGDVRVG